MKNIFRVARTELALLFFSPIAWLALVIFAFQFGYTFIAKLEQAALLSGNPDYLKTAFLYSGSRGLFSTVQTYLYFYIPVLTMGLVSRELQSGSIKLAFSSPVRVVELLMGKYLAMLVYGALLIGIIAILGVTGLVLIKPTEAPLVWSGLLGLYLSVCLYSAIGLFMSCLTAYPVIAAISTFIILAVLNYVGSIWQQFDLFRIISATLDINNRSRHLISGLISSRDILYFLMMCLLFVGLAVIYLNSLRRSENPWKVARRYVVFVACVLVIGGIGNISKFTYYEDVTATQSQTLSRGTRRLLKKMDTSLEVTMMGNILQRGTVDNLLPEQKSAVYAGLDPYQRFLKQNIRVKWMYFYDSLDQEYNDGKKLPLTTLARNAAITLGLDTQEVLSPAAMRKYVDTRFEWGRSVMRLAYRGRQGFVRIPFGDFFRDREAEIAAGLQQMFVDAPRLVFLKGHHERTFYLQDDREYSDRFYLTGYNSLIYRGFELTSCAPEDLKNLDTSVILVLADPTIPYDAADIGNINAYLEKGGNAWIAGDPKHRDIIAPISRQFGIRYDNDIFLSHITGFDSNLVQLNFSPEAATLTDQIGDLTRNGANMYSHDMAPLIVDSATRYQVKPFLLNSDTGTWVRHSRVMGAGKEFNPGAGDRRQALPVAFSITRAVNGRQQRILFFSHAGIPANNEFSGLPKKNAEFIESSFGWLNYNVFPVDTRRPLPKKETVNLVRNQWLALRFIMLWIFPALLVVLGSLVLLLRARR